MVLITGCSDLDERPFVMACMPENVFDYKERQKSVLEKDTATFDFNAGGIPFPSPEEMDRRSEEIFQGKMYTNIAKPSYSVGYFGQGVLTDTQGELPKEHKTFAMFSHKGNLLAKYGRGDKIYRYRRDPGDFIEERTGAVEMEHYYLDSSGELHPIHFQIGALNVGRVSTHSRPLSVSHRQIHIGAMIPPDAKYVVYKATWHIHNHDNHNPENTFTGYWAHALTDDYRYQPGDYDFAKDHQLGLGMYVMWSNVGSGRSSHIGHPKRGDQAKLAPEVGGDGIMKGHTVPCYGVAGQPVSSNHFMRIKGTYDNENAVHPDGRGSLQGFVGTTEEDLSRLPSNPNKWSDVKDEYAYKRYDL